MKMTASKRLVLGAVAVLAVVLGPSLQFPGVILEPNQSVVVNCPDGLLAWQQTSIGSGLAYCERLTPLPPPTIDSPLPTPTIESPLPTPTPEPSLEPTLTATFSPACLPPWCPTETPEVRCPDCELAALDRLNRMHPAHRPIGQWRPGAIVSILF